MIRQNIDSGFEGRKIEVLAVVVGDGCINDLELLLLHLCLDFLVAVWKMKWRMVGCLDGENGSQF